MRDPGNTQAEIPPATPFWTPHQVRGDMLGLSNTGSFRAPTRNPGNTRAGIPPATPSWTPHQVRGDMPGTPPIAGPPVPGNPGNTRVRVPTLHLLG